MLSRIQDNCPQGRLFQDNWPLDDCPPENCPPGKLSPPTIPPPTNPPNDCSLDDCPQRKLQPREFVPPPDNFPRGKLPSPCTIASQENYRVQMSPYVCIINKI